MAGPGLTGEAGEPPRLAVAVDDLGTGLWAGKVKQELEARVPLRNVLLSLSRAAVAVDELPIRYLDARSDPQLQRLRQLAHSPVAWFRSPLVHIVLASCGEYEDYKRDLRLRLKAMADTESSAPAQPELLFVYLRPPGADAAAKGPARVYDTMRRDLNRRRDRCVRLDPSAEPGAPGLGGLEDFEQKLKDALRAAFEARAAAYAEEVRRLMLNRLDPSWSFSTLFLVKDGLAAMLEAAGLLEDALREYAELEACYLEALQSGQQARQAFGGGAAGEDEAALLWASWVSTRQAASQPELPPEWVMRQALFASQARLLLKLHRHAEVAERGLAFVRSFGSLLAAQERAGAVPPQLREAWSCAAYLSLAAATSRLQAARLDDKRKTDTAGRGGARRSRLSDVGPPGSPPPGAEGLPEPIPLSPTAVGITKLQVRIADSLEGNSISPQHSQQPQLDWQLGALPSGGAAMAATAAVGKPASGGRGGAGREPAGAGAAGLYCLLGKLYCGARTELLRLGAAAGLELPKPVSAADLLEARQHTPALPAAAAIPAAPASQPPAAAAVATPPRLVPADADQASDSMAEAPSSSDLAQVDLDAPADSGSAPVRGGGGTDTSQAPSLSPGVSTDQAAAALKLTSAAETQPEADSEAGSAAAGGPQMGVSPRQVAPSPLQRTPARSRPVADADSASSSPRSTSTHQSSLYHAASDVQSSVDAGHAVAAAPVPPLQLEQNDMRSAERQVVSALADRPSARGSSRLGAAQAPHAAAAEAAAAASGAAAAAAAVAELPPWLVHWRLRAALSSQELFSELFIELSEAAAKCYVQCGYQRNAALLRADVAAALTKAGSVRRAAELYERQCRIFLREGWHALAAATLPKLAACQQAMGSPGLAQTAAALLSLPPPFHGTASERQAACQMLLQAASLQSGQQGSASPLLMPTSPTASEPAINLSAVLAAAPPKPAVSRFFGRTDADGTAQLVPPARQRSAAGGDLPGALRAAVGDALPVRVVVRSQLPVALPLRDVVLTLAVLQEMTVIHSPRASAAPHPLFGPASQTPHRSSVPSTPRGGDAAGSSLEPAGSLSRERFELQWQQVEELTCSLVDMCSWEDSGATSGGGGGALARPSLQPVLGEVSLPPVASVLTFLVAPVQRGLYKALHMRARLHGLPLQVEVEAPEQVWQQQLEAAAAAAAAAHSRGGMSAQARRRSSRAGVPSGNPLTPLAGGTPLSQLVPQQQADAPAGARSAEPILLAVEQAQPRVQLSLLAPGGTLIAGQEQWLGLALAPDRDALHGARLELTWPLAHATPAMAVLSPVARKGTGAGPRHRLVHSIGGDMRLSPASSATVALAPTPHPFIRPEHRSAVLLPAGRGDGGGSSGGPHAPLLLPAEGPSGPAAAWLLSEGLVQQLALPLVREGCPVTLWWRVTAGDVPTPPEQVHIAPPAPRRSTRALDARRLAGLPADVQPPAAVLELPASLEYVSGCQRSHCRLLAAPVQQPFAVASAARELPSGAVAVQFTLTSSLAVPAQVARVALEPQPAFSLTSSLLDGMGLLPICLAPGGSLTAAFLLAPQDSAQPAGAGGRGGDAAALLPAKLQPSVLSLDYTVDSRQQCGMAATVLGSNLSQQQQGGAGGMAAEGAGGGNGAGTAADQPQQQEQQPAVQQQTPSAAVLDLLGGGGSPAPSREASWGEGGASPTTVAEEGGVRGVAGVAGLGGASGGSRQLCSFRHLLTLELPASEDATTGTVVFVRLLGPFSATVGQPTTLCWRLERGGQHDQQLSPARVAFEVHAASDHWRPLGRRAGGVTLDGHSGAVATVEATWVPLAAGTLPVPALQLQDVPSQEVYDVGLSGGSSITVAEAAAGS